VIESFLRCSDLLFNVTGEDVESVNSFVNRTPTDVIAIEKNQINRIMPVILGDFNAIPGTPAIEFLLRCLHMRPLLLLFSLVCKMMILLNGDLHV
jgi:hypothetical protein